MLKMSASFNWGFIIWVSFIPCILDGYIFSHLVIVKIFLNFFNCSKGGSMNAWKLSSIYFIFYQTKLHHWGQRLLFVHLIIEEKIVMFSIFFLFGMEFDKPFYKKCCQLLSWIHSVSCFWFELCLWSMNFMNNKVTTWGNYLMCETNISINRYLFTFHFFEFVSLV